MAETTTTLTFRHLEPNDFDVVTQLFDEWFPVKYDWTFRFQICNGVSPYNTLAAVSPQEGIVGIVIFQYKSTLSIENNVWTVTHHTPPLMYHHDIGCHILILGVRKEFRRQKVASQLVDKVVSQCLLRKNCLLLYLHTMTTNEAAIRFYTSVGFHQSTDLHNYYHLPGGVIADGVCFCMDFDKPQKWCTIL